MLSSFRMMELCCFLSWIWNNPVFYFSGLAKSDFNPYMWRRKGEIFPNTDLGERERVGSVEKLRTDRSCKIHYCCSQNFGKIGKTNKQTKTQGNKYPDLFFSISRFLAGVFHWENKQKTTRHGLSNNAICSVWTPWTQNRSGKKEKKKERIAWETGWKVENMKNNLGSVWDLWTDKLYNFSHVFSLPKHGFEEWVFLCPSQYMNQINWM